MALILAIFGREEDEGRRGIAWRPVEGNEPSDGRN